MTAAFTVTSGGLTLAAARELADRIGADWRIEASAVALNETDETRSSWNVVTYVADAEAASTVTSLYDGEAAPLPGADWVGLSLKGLEPVIAGRFFLHGSHDRNRRRPGGVALEIDAGTAFGTGHHGTTEGCLLALDGVLKRKRPARVLDVGCGTGVLAIAAAKASRGTALASDIDPEAVRVTTLNAARNGVRTSVRAIVAAGLKARPIAAAAPYDLIFANILARPLAMLAQGLARNLRPGGALILSGLTLDQCRWITAVYRNHGLVSSGKIIRGNWAALVLTKPRIN